MDVLDVRKDNIWGYAQNKPSLIAKDLEGFGVPYDVSMKVLLARGVFKWLSVRRKLIKLKNTWLESIKNTEADLTKYKAEDNQYMIAYNRGYLKAMAQARQDIRTLCHSERWQCPDYDEKSQKFLLELEKEQTGGEI